MEANYAHLLPDMSCPHIKIKSAGDESIDLCDLNDTICLLVSGDACEIQQEHLKEMTNENS